MESSHEHHRPGMKQPSDSGIRRRGEAVVSRLVWIGDHFFQDTMPKSYQELMKMLADGDTSATDKTE